MDVTGNLVDEMLLLCLRGRWNPSALKAARKLASRDSFDWEAWYAAAQAEALSPLLYRLVHGQSVVPAGVEKRLQTVYYLSLMHNARAFRELGHLVSGLAAEGVSTILLKGAALAEMIYGNIAVRQMVDLDLLVHFDDAQAALRVLRAVGYASAPTEPWPGDTIAFGPQIMLRKPGAIHTVAVHWHLLDSPYYQNRVPMGWFWQTALPARVDGATTLMLGPEAQTLYLCAHLALHHRARGLRWLHDVAEVLHFFEDRLDWQMLLAKAADYDLVLPLQQILPCVVEGWDAPAPAGVLEQLGRLDSSPEAVRVFRWLSVAKRPVVQRFWADLASMPGWRERLRYGLKNLFPSPSYMRQRYRVQHDFLLPLCYPYRWLVGLRHHPAVRQTK